MQCMQSSTWRGRAVAVAVAVLGTVPAGVRADVIVPVEQDRCVGAQWVEVYWGSCEPDCPGDSGSCGRCATDFGVFSWAASTASCVGTEGVARQVSALRDDALVVTGRASGGDFYGMGRWCEASTSSRFDVLFDLTRSSTVLVIADLRGSLSYDEELRAEMRLVNEDSGEIITEIVIRGDTQEELEETFCLESGRYRLVARAYGVCGDCDGSGEMAVALEVCTADLDCSGTVDTHDLIDLLSAWGDCEGCREDVDGSGVVDTGDLLELLAAWGPCTADPDWLGACHLDDGSCHDGLSASECAVMGGTFSSGGVCRSIRCCPGAGGSSGDLLVEEYVGDGWEDHGFPWWELTAYRVYAEFDEVGDDGVLSVFGAPGLPLRVTSSDGLFHNAPDGLDRHTAPLDLRFLGVWENQWDTYVTIGTDTATGNATGLSGGFAEETNGLRTSFETTSAAWFVVPEDEQSRSRDGRVLLGQFVVAQGETLEGVLNLLLRDGGEEQQLVFGGGCSAGP
jgi:hypothetical protein